ncbi:YdcF family protein [uncultured Paludibaculum sp.]|uniref:YdcF family protein n=1 Tax=uncultured Paludibaculum sp. TaxID=1765020 RepID=UPI002AAA9B29|nr:YdcF family protein [uncultured Paludibaculum sp.]
MRRLIAIAFLVIGLPLATYLVVVAKQIEGQSVIDESQKSDIIVVLGAAEYNGRPSPVLKARLDHAFDLYQKGHSNLILTTGGAGGDQQFTEGQVGRDYLVRRGIAAEAIVVEGQGDSTVGSLLAVSEIMRRMGLVSAIVVSDGYHIFRAKRILEHEGMKVYGSPRPYRQQGTFREQWLYVRQALGYLLWRVGINI